MLKKKKTGAVTFLKTANTITISIIILATATARMGETSLFRRVLFTFHMPIFFLLCGLALVTHKGKGENGWCDFLRKMALSFIFPYFLWSLIYSNFSYRNLIWLLYGSYEALIRAGTLPILWFFPCMFAARIILEGVISLASGFDSVKRFALPLLAVFLFLVGILLPKLGNLSYPWCINIAFTVAGFMLLGYSMKPLIEKIAKNPVCTVLIFVLSATVFTAGSVLRADRLEMVLLRSGDYGDIVWFFVNSLSGCLLILSISSLISRNWKKHGPVINEQNEEGINRVTMGILVIHMPLLQQVVLPLLGLIPFAIPKMLIFLVGMAVTKFISGYLIKVIARYVPQLFGIFPDRQKTMINAEDI